ncbi:MAG: glyoxalase superfamily protein [Cyanobacteria bacterium P01_F01_bin.150]
MVHGSSVSILRIFDVDKAMEFYCDYLGYSKEWEHQFGEKMPLYISVKSGNSEIHLSEHHGDSTPGSAIRIHVQGLKDYYNTLKSRNYKFMNPGLEKTPWGHQVVTVKDPFGNKLTFWEEIQE